HDHVRGSGRGRQSEIRGSSPPRPEDRDIQGRKGDNAAGGLEDPSRRLEHNAGGPSSCPAQTLGFSPERTRMNSFRPYELQPKSCQLASDVFAICIVEILDDGAAA